MSREKKKREPTIYRCQQCGEIAHYGFRVNIRAGKDGEWFCKEHKPTTVEKPHER